MLSSAEVMQLIESLIWLLSGVGVFIVGMNFMSEALEKSAGWNRSTTLTVLRRMEKKGMVQLDDSQKLQRFSAAVPQERAILQETRNFIDRVYHGSLGLMLTTLTEKKDLSSAEVAELRAIFERAGSDDV